MSGLSRLTMENTVFTLEGKIQLQEKEAWEVIETLHREGYLGISKTWKAFNRKYATDGGREKCTQMVRTFREYQLGNDYKIQHVPRGNIESPGPWEVVSIDIMGPFPYDRLNRRFIITIMDAYSRYLIAVPTKDHTAKIV